MNRKNTILLAVLINAGLLVVLFITALTTPDEITVAPTHEMSVAPKQEVVPLFNDEMDVAVRQELPKIVPEPVVHALPPVTTVPEPAPFSPIASLEAVVKKGDTLEKIAKAHNTTVDEIIKLNQLSSTFLRVGQTLKIPNEKTIAAKPAVAEVTSSDYYTVKVGDNPWSIAMKNHIKVEELLKLNALNEEKARKLKEGDRLRIR